MHVVYTCFYILFVYSVLEDLSHEERSMFVRFCWGRSRLPLTLEGFSQKFTIKVLSSSPADAYFPVSHTCNFSLDLPRYTTLEAAREKMKYAILNCQNIDG